MTSSSIFCSRCLRNQQYHYDVMKQLEVEFDPEHPNYQACEEKARLVKKDLDNRYPMVCENCAPKAQEQRDRADKFAKSDWLGRLNALSELMRSQKTWKGTFQNVIYQTMLYPLVSNIWYLIIFGQMVALVLGFFNVTDILIKALNFIPYFSNDLTLIIISFLASKRYFGLSILYNFLSCGMNPFFSRWYPRGNPRRIGGFLNWYGYQLLLQLALRVILGSIFENGFFTHLSSFNTMIANICAIFFNLLIAYGSRSYLGPKKISLWKSTPGPVYTPSTFETSEKSGNTMSDVLDEIMASTSRTPSPPASHAQRSSTYTQEQSYQPVYQSHTSGFRERTSANTYNRNYNRRHEILRQPDLLLKTTTSGMNPIEFQDYLATGAVPDWKIQEGEEMDWDPTITHVQHNFNIRPRAVDTTPNYAAPVQPFGQSLPSAQAPASFNALPQNPAFQKTSKVHHEIKIANARFHAPNPAAYQLDSSFEKAFENFSLKEKEVPTKDFGKLSIGKALGISLLFGGLAVGAGAYYNSKSSSQDEISSSLENLAIENTSTL